MTPAARLASAESAFLDAERDVEALIDALYDKWTSFEVNADEIAVFGCTPSDAVATALRRAGWRTVTQHDHCAEKFIACACRRSET